MLRSIFNRIQILNIRPRKKRWLIHVKVDLNIYSFFLLYLRCIPFLLIITKNVFFTTKNLHYVVIINMWQGSYYISNNSLFSQARSTDLVVVWYPPRDWPRGLWWWPVWTVRPSHREPFKNINTINNICITSSKYQYNTSLRIAGLKSL